MAKFGNWLEHQLARRQMNQAELAKLVGTSTGTVSNWVNDVRVPTPASCERIADALFVAVDEVLTQAGHRPADILISPDSPTGQLMPLIEKVDWTRYPDRLESLKMELRWMIERDREAKKG